MVLGSFPIPGRDDARLVRIDPLLNGPFLGKDDIDQVVLVPRHVGGSLDRPSDAPVAVHIALSPRGDHSEPVETIAWGDVIWDLKEMSLP
jgi:hypothetical protein